MHTADFTEITSWDYNLSAGSVEPLVSIQFSLMQILRLFLAPLLLKTINNVVESCNYRKNINIKQKKGGGGKESLPDK